MNLLKKAFNFFRRELRIDDPDGWTNALPHGFGPVSTESAMSLSVFWACVSLQSGIISSLPPMVYKTDANGDRKVFRDHPLYYLLHESPNKEITPQEFWEFISICLEVKGNAYAVKNRIGSRVVSLEPLNPGVVSVRRNSSNAIEYSWTLNGRSYVGSSDDVLHFRGFGGDALGGLSTLRYAANTLGLAQALNESANATFHNSMRPSGVITIKEYIGKESRDDVKKAMKAEYAGTVNAGVPMILEGGQTWQSLSINPEDAQLLESRGFSIEEICRFFSVPPFMIGHTEKTTSWGTGVEQQILAYQKFSLNKRVTRIEQRVIKDLLTPEDKARGVKFEFNMDGLLRGDTLSRYNAYMIGIQNGFVRINEARRRENEPPVPWGDEPFKLQTTTQTADKPSPQSEAA